MISCRLLHTKTEDRNALRVAFTPSTPKMKCLLLCFVAIVGIAAADISLLDDAEPLLCKIEELPLLLQKARNSVPLRIAVGQPHNRNLDILETLFREKAGQYLRQHLEGMLKKLVELRYTTEDVAQKFEEILKKSPSKEAAEEFFKELASLEGEKDMIIKIVEAFFYTENAHETAMYYASERGVIDHIDNLLEKLKQWYTGLGAWISDNLDDFKAWAKVVFTTLIDASKPIRDQIKELAIDFLKENWHTLSKRLVKQALSFFHPYAGILGEQLVDRFIEVAKEKGLVPWEPLPATALY